MDNGTSIILVPGAWHSVFHTTPLAPFIEELGYRFVPLQLPSSSKARGTAEDNIKIIHKTIKTEIDAGRQVAVISHSVSGLTVVGAVASFLESATREQAANLVSIVCIASFWNPFRSLAEAKWYEINMEKGEAFITSPAAEIFYNDMPTEDAKPFVDALEYNVVMMPPEQTGAWWKTIHEKVKRLHYIVCLKDNAVPAKYQRLEAAEQDLQIIELEVDHCPMTSRPRELASALHKILS